MENLTAFRSRCLWDGDDDGVASGPAKAAETAATEAPAAAKNSRRFGFILSISGARLLKGFE